MAKMHRLAIVVLVLLLPATAWSAIAQTPGIEWHVADRFRLFRADAPPRTIVADPGASVQDDFLERLASASNNSSADQDRATFPELSLYEQIARFLGSEAQGRGPVAGSRPFERTRWQGAGPSLGAKPNELQHPGKVRGYDDQYLYPEGYTVRAWAVGTLPEDQCRWTIDASSTALTLPCRQMVLIPVASRNDHTGGKPTGVALQVFRSSELIATPSTIIKVEDRLIMGLGESYASGEGNPDLPQSYTEDFQKSVASFWTQSADPYDRWWRVGKVLATVKPARWWDPVCHRSLYSQQAAAAFIYAAARPKEAVTFATFACSGAEVLDGLIARQSNPPGISDFGYPGGDNSFKLTAQVEQALSLLCQNKLSPNAPRVEMASVVDDLRILGKARKTILESATVTEAMCADPRVKPRRVDVVLLSVGGNDVGFAGAVKNALLPTQAADPFGQFVLAKARSNLGVTPAFVAHRKIMFDLPRVYPELRAAMRNSLAVDGVPIIQSTYPNPLMDQGSVPVVDEKGSVSTTPDYCHGFNDNRLFSAMNGMFPDQKIKPENRWRVDINQAESREVREALFDPLNNAVKTNAGAGGNWRTISYDKEFATRGWCAGTSIERENYGFPGLTHVSAGDSAVASNGKSTWAPIDPERWDPYAPRTRLFRTANDVVLTQVGSNKPFAKWFVNLGNKSFFATSGIFHPSAQAHTIMGMKAALEMQDLLSPADAR